MPSRCATAGPVLLLEPVYLVGLDKLRPSHAYRPTDNSHSRPRLGEVTKQKELV